VNDVPLPRLMRMKRVAQVLGVSRWTVRRLAETDPTFPRFIEIAPRVRVIREADLAHWLRLRQLDTVAQRGAPPAPD